MALGPFSTLTLLVFYWGGSATTTCDLSRNRLTPMLEALMMGCVVTCERIIGELIKCLFSKNPLEKLSPTSGPVNIDSSVNYSRSFSSDPFLGPLAHPLGNKTPRQDLLKLFKTVAGSPQDRESGSRLDGESGSFKTSCFHQNFDIICFCVRWCAQPFFGARVT